MKLSTQLLTTKKEWENLNDEWRTLLSHSVTNHFFQTPTFAQTWWETLGVGELHIVTIRKGTELVGMMPCCITEEKGKKQLCFVGCVDVSDYLDFIVHKEYEEQVYAAIEAHITELKNSKKIDSFYFCSIPDDSPTRTYLKNKLGFKQKKQDVCPQIELPSSWEEYLDSLERKQRHEIRRKWRKLENEYSHSFRRADKKQGIEQLTNDFTMLHKLSSTDKNDFWTEHHLAFFRKLLVKSVEEKTLELFFLDINDEPVATMLAFNYNQRFYLYNSGFNPQEYKEVSTGNTLLAYTIKYAIENNFKIYDFLRGDEEYKFRFGAVSKPVWDLSLETL